MPLQHFVYRPWFMSTSGDTPGWTLMHTSSLMLNPLTLRPSSSAWVLPRALKNTDCVLTVSVVALYPLSWQVRHLLTQSNLYNTVFGTAHKGYVLMHTMVSVTAPMSPSSCTTRNTLVLISFVGITALLMLGTLSCKCGWCMSSHAWVFSSPTPLPPPRVSLNFLADLVRPWVREELEWNTM